MAKFFVGQMVRITWVKHQKNAHLIGTQGRISEIRENFLHGECGYGLDAAPITCTYEESGFSAVIAWRSSQLEPISPEGQEPAQFSFHELMDRLRSGVVA